MEVTQTNQLVVAKNDHDMLIHFMRTNNMELKYDKAKSRQFLEEIANARIVANSEFPTDVVRLNSKVVIRNTIARQNYNYTVVLPDKADQKNEKVSILAPMGIALFGAKKGATISLPSARGKHHYIIQEVVTQVD